MSKTEYCSFSQKLAFHTAPTLLGIKCANLISLSTAEFDLEFHSEYFNNKVAEKGLKSRILCSCGSRTLMLVYSEKMLENRLVNEDVKNILTEYGYPDSCSLEEYLEHLSKRIRESEIFPHEIGIFLGYPMEDVVGFIENKGENFKLCGAWKVYENVECAQRTFINYERCRNFLCNKLNEGVDIYQALRIS
ncbi:MAG: DUF3793 family protein [Porcipelethomonas sp.]